MDLGWRRSLPIKMSLGDHKQRSTYTTFKCIDWSSLSATVADDSVLLRRTELYRPEVDCGNLTHQYTHILVTAAESSPHRPQTSPVTPCPLLASKLSSLTDNWLLSSCHVRRRLQWRATARCCGWAQGVFGIACHSSRSQDGGIGNSDRDKFIIPPTEYHRPRPERVISSCSCVPFSGKSPSNSSCESLKTRRRLKIIQTWENWTELPVSSWLIAIHLPVNCRH